MTLIKVKLRGTDNVSTRRNLISNGGMQVAQRGTSFTSVAATAYHLDRWQYYVALHDELRTTVSQDSSVPTGADSGFSKSLKIDCTTAESAIAADENLRVWQKIEAQDLVRLGYGSSGAKSTTLSFYVKSSLTGTYAISFWCQDPNRNISKTYTISAANTWERKTVTIPGDTGGTGINVDNGEGMRINWFLNAGSNFTSTNTNNQWDAFASGRHAFGHTAAWGTNTSHDFFLTGVQFEIGDDASDFEHRSFEDELHACKRYYQKSFNYDTAPENGGGSGVSFNGGLLGYCGSNNSGTYSGFHRFDPEMRATPTVVTYGNSSGHWGRLSPTNTGTVSYSAGSGYISNTKASGINFGQNAAGDTLLIGFGHITADAEL